MTWAGRFRLLAGLVVVLLIAALATYKLNESRGIATSDSAQILGKTYNVGTPYAGLVVNQAVEIGDEVREGETLFVIDAASLHTTTGEAPVVPETTHLDDEGRLVVTASGPGVVTAVAATQGTFVQAATDLATVQRDGTLYVQAEYTLSPKEYARVPDDAAVSIELPDQTTVAGHVDRVQVETVDGKAQAVVTVVSDGLDEGDQDGLVSAGTPVVAQLHLRNDGVVTTVSDAVKGYLKDVVG
ncbi:HlyD family efflux transporter periplasmic adaptor subunit [Cellulomonas sp. PhB150]|uniref:HlyD family efflux transporter periplasmic adaptor subunit n=1 Tax=Cellulomonas sp. PhB150 TaxID=2485188 RepID=UPI000F48A517|nr:HlyD family efflux transporter periplasmic adaptor subunit [Cellulomonas sp. PhB150]ROS23646.1 HlyD family secretion protein [Cellulomonas sp. PhB150]